MFRVPDETVHRFDAAMEAAGVAVQERGYYQKWLRYYLDFCRKYGCRDGDSNSLTPFIEKLAGKNQSDSQRRQASRAVRLYLGMSASPEVSRAAENEEDQTARKGSLTESSPGTGAGSKASQHGKLSNSPKPRRREAQPSVSPSAAGNSKADSLPASGASWAQELEELRNSIRLRNYSPRTSKTYTHWTRKFQSYTRSKPPSELDAEDVKEFLTDLAVRQNVAASTQNQAFNALLYFFRHVLGKEFGKIDGVVRAKRRRYIPVVLSREEVDRVVAELEHPYDLVVLLLYGCGLRISEALDLRIHCFNLDEGILTVHDGKGQKDRTVPLPKVLLPRIRKQFELVAAQLEEDLAKGYAGVFLPRQLDKKYPNAGSEFVWQWFFPAKQISFVKAKGEHRRYRVLDSDVQKAVKTAANEARIPKRVTPHTFRHTFASHLLRANVDIRTIQERLGHSDVKTTMIYTHTVPSRTLKDAGSPLDMQELP